MLPLPGCAQSEPLQPIARAKLKTPTPGPFVPPDRWRDELRTAYRLPLDGRFLLAVGEIDRLAGRLPAPPGRPATAEFVEGRWRLRDQTVTVGDVPELPDFSDLFGVLVAHATRTLPRGGAPASADLRPSAAFLMPGLLSSLSEGERALASGRYLPAAQSWARLAFQMPDRLELAPLIPARALALLAAARSRDPRAGIEEEALLASALGYTRHAEKVSAKLPAESDLRAFVGADSRAIADAASRAGASEEARYLAVRRATSRGELAAWTSARQRFLPANDSVSVVATGLEIELPRQVEVEDRGYQLLRALPRAVVRELLRMPDAMPPNFEAIASFGPNLKRVSSNATGALWDGPAMEAYYEGAYYSSIGEEFTPQMFAGAGGQIAWLVNEYWKTKMPPDPRGDPRGAALLLRWIHFHYEMSPPGDERAYVEMRALVPWLDTRPSHRADFAGFARYQLHDARMAEALYRSLDAVLNDGTRKAKADAAVYLGDGATLHRLLSAPDLAHPEATAILWSWYVAKRDRDALFAEWDQAIERFPHDWGPTNTYVNLLRERKDYAKACRIVERFLERNPDPRSPGRYHAHIRLAHNYVLAGEFAKGLTLLEGMHESQWFQQANQKRGMAECLAGLGRLPEAEKLAREAAAQLRDQSEAWRDLIKILWMQGKDAEAVALILKPPLAEWEQCDVLRHELPEALDRAPRDRVVKALDAVNKEPLVARWSGCAVEGFGEAGRFDEAVLVGERVPLMRGYQLDRVIQLYGYARQIQGPEAAAAWLNANLPPGSRNPICMRALTTRKYELLWDAIGTPDPADRPEWVWLARATASALTGPEEDPHRAELRAHYASPSEERHDVIARYVLGLAGEDEFMKVAANTRDRAEIAFYLGVRAVSEKRYGDACEWYRVAAEAGKGSFHAQIALGILKDWAELGAGLWSLEGR